jgi:hypothetical protein
MGQGDDGAGYFNVLGISLCRKIAGFPTLLQLCCSGEKLPEHGAGIAAA